jgi:hypothetical protein
MLISLSVDNFLDDFVYDDYIMKNSIT